MSAVGEFVQNLNKNVEGNEMKTVAFTTALTTLVLATAADADAQNRQCRFWGGSQFGLERHACSDRSDRPPGAMPLSSKV
jgi:hypothetical protein